MTFKPCFTDAHLVQKAHYYGEFALSLGKESHYTFSKFNLLNTVTVFSPGRGLAGFPQEKLKWRIKTKKMRLLGRKGKLRVKRT